MNQTARQSLTVCALAAVMALAGCKTVEYRTFPLQGPPRPILPTVQASEITEVQPEGEDQPFVCMPEDAWARLTRRDLYRKQYAEELEAVIRSTRRDGDEDQGEGDDGD